MRKASLGTIFLTVLLDLLGFGLVVPYLPGVARSYGASDLTAALLGAVYSLMQFLFVPIWGHLSDRTGRRPILLASIAASALGMAALGTVGSLVGLFVARALVGIATSNLAVASAYIADVTEPKDRSRGMGMIGAAIGIGFVLGPFFGGILEAHSPLARVGAMPAYTAAALSLVNLILGWRFLPESLPAAKRNSAPVRAAEVHKARLRVAQDTPGVWSAFLVHFVAILFFSGMETTFALFTHDAFALRTAETGYLLGLVGLVLIIVQGGLIRWLARLASERVLVRVGLSVQALGFAIAALSPSSATHGVLWLAHGMSLLALGSGLANPSLSAIVSRLAPADRQGTMLGAMQSAGALARVVGPATGGLLYQSLGPRAPYAAAAIGMLVALAASVGLRKPKDVAPAIEEASAT